MDFCMPFAVRLKSPIPCRVKVLWITCLEALSQIKGFIWNQTPSLWQIRNRKVQVWKADGGVVAPLPTPRALAQGRPPTPTLFSRYATSQNDVTANALTGAAGLTSWVTAKWYNSFLGQSALLSVLFLPNTDNSNQKDPRNTGWEIEHIFHKSSEQGETSTQPEAAHEIS